MINFDRMHVSSSAWYEKSMDNFLIVGDGWRLLKHENLEIIAEQIKNDGFSQSIFLERPKKNLPLFPPQCCTKFSTNIHHDSCANFSGFTHFFSSEALLWTQRSSSILTEISIKAKYGFIYRFLQQHIKIPCFFMREL